MEKIKCASVNLQGEEFAEAVREQVIKVLSTVGFFERESVWESLGMTKEELDAELELGHASGSSGLSHRDVFARYKR